RCAPSRPGSGPRRRSRGGSGLLGVGVGARAELAVLVQPPAPGPVRAMIIDIFEPAAFPGAAIVVAGLLQPADALAGLVTNEFAVRFLGSSERRCRNGKQGDGKSQSHPGLGLKREEV